MLEIFGIIALCNVNRKNAVARGQTGGKYIGFTILLWLGFEFLGAFIGGMMELGIGAYVLALVFAAVGGFISYKLAKGNGAPPVSANTAAPPHVGAATIPQMQAGTPFSRTLVFIGTTGFLIDPNTPEGRAYAEQIRPFAIDRLRGENAVFAQKYEYAKTHNLPLKIGFGTGENENAMSGALLEWLRREGCPVLNMSFAMGKTLFVQVGDAQNPQTGRAMTWYVAVYFAER